VVKEGVPVGRIDVSEAGGDHEEDDASLSATIAELSPALSWMPITSTTVSKATITTAGRSKTMGIGPRCQAPAMVSALGAQRVEGERGRQMEVEQGQKRLEIMRPAVRDGARGDGVLEDEIPADDPRDQLPSVA